MNPLLATVLPMVVLLHVIPVGVPLWGDQLTLAVVVPPRFSRQTHLVSLPPCCTDQSPIVYDDAVALYVPDVEPHVGDDENSQSGVEPPLLVPGDVQLGAANAKFVGVVTTLPVLLIVIWLAAYAV
jgi:hypothetical protein